MSSQVVQPRRTDAGDAWAAFEDSVYDTIQKAWPDVGVTGHPIYRVTQAQAEAWRGDVDSGKITPPWAVWFATDTTQKPGWGACNVMYAPLVTVVYCVSLARTGSDDSAGWVQQKYGVLEETLRNGGYTGFQLMEDADMTPDISDRNPGNRVFMASLLPYVGVSITFRALFGYTYYGPGQPRP